MPANSAPRPVQASARHSSASACLAKKVSVSSPAGAVPDDGLEHVAPAAAASWPHGARCTWASTVTSLADPQAGDVGELAPLVVAAREVAQQVADGVAGRSGARAPWPPSRRPCLRQRSVQCAGRSFDTDQQRVVRLAAVVRLHLHEGPVLGDVRGQRLAQVRPAPPRRGPASPARRRRRASGRAASRRSSARSVPMTFTSPSTRARTSPGWHAPGHRQRLAGGDRHLGVPAGAGRLGHGDHVVVEPARRSRTASAASACTGERVGTTATRTPSARASSAAADATAARCGSLGSTTTRPAPVARIAVEDLGRGRVARRATVDDDRALGGEHLGEPGAADDHDDRRAPSPSGHAAVGAGGLVGEAGDRDAVRPAGLHAGLDGGADVVDVHVHVPGGVAVTRRRRPPRASRPAPPGPPRSRVDGRLGRRRAGTAPRTRTRTSRSPGRRSASRGSAAARTTGAAAGASPVTTSTSASSSTTSPRPPASTTPARASTGSCSGVRASASAAPSAAARTTVARSSESAATAATAAAVATVSTVPSTGSATAAYPALAAAVSARRDRRPRAAGTAPSASAVPASSCATITPELPRAPSSAPRAMHRSTRARRGAIRRSAVGAGRQRPVGAAPARRRSA